MKKIILFFMIIMLSYNLEAQFIFNNKNVVILNDLNEDQLDFNFRRATYTIYAGLGMTFIGITALAAGFAIDKQSDDTPTNAPKLGETLMYCGGGFLAIGLPLTLDGYRKKKDIELMLIKFDNPTSMKSDNSTSSIGVGLSMKF